VDLGWSGEPWGALGRVPQWNPFRIQLPQLGEIWGPLGSTGELWGALGNTAGANPLKTRKYEQASTSFSRLQQASADFSRLQLVLGSSGEGAPVDSFEEIQLPQFGEIWGALGSFAGNS